VDIVQSQKLLEILHAISVEMHHMPRAIRGNFESFSEPEPSTSKESEPHAGIRSSQKSRGYSSEDSDEAEHAERNNEAEMVEKSDETELAEETSKGTLPSTDRSRLWR
jgi:hypothetical protein